MTVVLGKIVGKFIRQAIIFTDITSMSKQAIISFQFGERLEVYFLEILNHIVYNLNHQRW